MKQEYDAPFLTLAQWLEQELANMPDGAEGRIRIRDGAPPYRIYYGRGRFREHIHASVRYSNRKITFRSKHVTDRIMAASVVSCVQPEPRRTGGDKDVFVFIPKRMPRAHYEKPRKEKPDPGSGTQQPWWSGAAITIPDGIDEELPFN